MPNGRFILFLVTIKKTISINFPWIIQGKGYFVFLKSKASDMLHFGDIPHTGFTRHTEGVQKADLSRNSCSYRCRDAFLLWPYHPAAS